VAGYALTHLRWRRAVGSGLPPEDDAINTLFWGNGSGAVTTGDCDAFETLLKSFWDAGLKNYVSNDYRMHEFRHYTVPAVAGPFGAPLKVTEDPSGWTGTNGGTYVPQVAATVTMRTANRRRWGRIYLPGIVMEYSSAGRIADGAVDDIGADFASLVEDSRSTFDIGVVVWHRAGWNAETISAVSMDNIWDVQRRRRFANVTHRFLSPVSP
jgi:hypothetical protein